MSLNGSRHTFRRGLEVLMFPDSNDFPARIGQRDIGTTITSDVRFELWHPVLAIPLRNALVIRTAMPEATVDEDRDV